MTRAELTAVIGDAREILAIASKMTNGSVARRAIETRCRQIINRCDRHLEARQTEHAPIVETFGQEATR